MASVSLSLTVFISVWSVGLTSTTNTTVTLKHGGQLLGKRFNFENVDLDVFLSVPYAEPPVGDLRFKKPEEAMQWTGVKDATAANGDMCVQKSLLPDVDGSLPIIGSEDCLKLDITVPGGVSEEAGKAVMMYIHGGGYTVGSKNDFIGAGLAAKGDVIVVVVNYRLGPFGFLSDGTGTGNFGLWDMRQALLWIQENIAEFGGDPEMVTIFGESAGGSSVSSLVNGQYTEGLFKRAIQQSGTLYAEFGWYLSENERLALDNATKHELNCAMDELIYKCLSNLDIDQVMGVFPDRQVQNNPFHPTPDDDFFPSDISNENYELSKRFDSMIGFNADDGSAFIWSLENGTTYEALENELRQLTCPSLTKLSVELCVDYVTNLYGLDTITDDRQRGLANIHFFTDLMFGAEALRQLQAHSQTDDKATYAYYFTEQFDGAFIPELAQPSWLANNTADHVEDLVFLIGSYYLKDSDVWDIYYTSDAGRYIYYLVTNTVEADKQLSDVMITAWTNFAKSGDPNEPVDLPANTPQWPQFSLTSDAFMELNGQSRQVITTPNKDRLESLITTLYSARRQQKAADAPQQVIYEECQLSSTAERSSPVQVLTQSLLMVVILAMVMNDDIL